MPKIMNQNPKSKHKKSKQNPYYNPYTYNQTPKSKPKTLNQNPNFMNKTSN